ncbi:MAG: hypothetical protein QM831_09525 [Kofleriaceae bacterium]
MPHYVECSWTLHPGTFWDEVSFNVTLPAELEKVDPMIAKAGSDYVGYVWKDWPAALSIGRPAQGASEDDGLHLQTIANGVRLEVALELKHERPWGDAKALAAIAKHVLQALPADVATKL